MQTTDERFGKIQRTGGTTKWTQDFYHSLMVIGWMRFFLSFVGFFFLFNGVFASIYWLFPQTVAGTDQSFWQAFVFSVQTFSTVGYGAFLPDNNWGHAIVVLESLMSVFVTAVLTGLVFSKFSRPSARILFSKNVLINNFDGRRVLTLRIGNLRTNQIAEARVHVVALKSYVTVEGQTIRRQIDLNLIRGSSLFFALTWSIMHEIDEQSPLYNLTTRDFLEQNIEIAVSVIGYDSTFSQTVHTNCIYEPEDIVFDRYFEDVMESKNGKIQSLHYEKFHHLRE